MINGHTKRLRRKTANRFTKMEAELNLKVEAVQCEKGKAELNAKVISVS